MKGGDEMKEILRRLNNCIRELDELGDELNYNTNINGDELHRIANKLNDYYLGLFDKI